MQCLLLRPAGFPGVHAAAKRVCATQRPAHLVGDALTMSASPVRVVSSSSVVLAMDMNPPAVRCWPR